MSVSRAILDIRNRKPQCAQKLRTCSAAGYMAFHISVLTSSISSLFSLLGDEVGDNEKAKEISTTKKMPILI